MASPFKVFRKNQKVWMVGLIMVAMFGFVFLPTILDTMGGRSQQNPVAVTSKYGDLTEMELQNLQEYHSRTMGVLSGLLQPFLRNEADAEQYLTRFFGGSKPEDVAASWLLVQRAKSLGMSVSDERIKDFLSGMTQGHTDLATLKALIKRAGLSDRMFMQLMRDELLAYTMRNYFTPSIVAATPAQRWDYYCRLKRAAAIEAAPILAADYIDQVKEEPTDEELKKFFAKHRDELPNPYSPKPGFKRPQKVELEYFKAEVDKFATPELISEEEVLERYNKNKDKYEQPVRMPAEQKPAEEKKADAEEEKTAQPETEKAPVKEPEEKQPAATPTPEPTEPPKDAAEPKSSSSALNSPFKLTAFQQPEDKEKEKAEPETPEKPAAEPAVETPKTTEKQPEKVEKAAETKPEPPKETETAKPAEQPKTGPSDSVKEMIRREIAAERIGEMFKRLGDQMNNYRDKRNEYEFSSPQQKAASIKPEPLDFAKLAEENGLTAGRTGLGDEWAIAKEEIGSAFGRTGFISGHAFKAMAKYRPEQAMSLSGDLYLLWKTNEEDEKVRNFDNPDVRDMVLRAWKMEKAWELAKKEAEALAEEARAAKKPLAEVFADRKNIQVLQPLPFTWMTSGYAANRQEPKISAVEGIDYAGDDFMKAVFQLEPDGIGTAPNAPKNVVYVVRLIDYSPLFSTLWEGYKVTKFFTYSSVAQRDRQRMHQDWLEEVKRDADFKWTEAHEEYLERIRSRQDEQQ